MPGLTTPIRIGIDLGGTKIEIVAIDRSGTVVLRRRVASPAHDYAAIIETIGNLVFGAESELGVVATVGVGMPGAPSHAGAIKNANSTVLIGKPFRDDLSRRLDRDVRIANDANCFALSEASDGAGRGSACVVGIILGTGVGSGIVFGGRLHTGRNAIAGEWGHNPLPWPSDAERPGPACYCGKRGCIETFLSGPGLVRDAGLPEGTTSAGVPGVVAAAAGGSELAIAALERYYDRLARSLATLIDVLDPDTIVLGGGVSNMVALYDALPRRLAAYVFSDTIETEIVAAMHGDSSGVRGAAWLWP